MLNKGDREKNGFTTVELVVVVLVIGFLGVMSLISIASVRSRGRDARRVSDIKAIGEALVLYSNDFSFYPCSSDGQFTITGADCLSTTLRSAGAIISVPLDPRDSGNIVYRYCSSMACTGQEDGSQFVITYWLETDAIYGKNTGYNTLSL